MIIVIKKHTDKDRVDALLKKLNGMGVNAVITQGESFDTLNVIGDTTKIDEQSFKAYDFVESVKRISAPFKLASDKTQKVINVGNVNFGKDFVFIAGPCAVESEKQIVELAQDLKKAGANILRGGAFKPRTSPYSFQGLYDEGIKLLLKAKQQTGLPIISEIMGVSQLDLFCDVDIVQIGARNMQNFELIKNVATLNKPVMLKRGLANTVTEWLLSAEYLLSNGASDVILCERGIRTFETTTRATLDLTSVPYLKDTTNLPVIIDPSHAVGVSKFIKPLALAGASVGADGLMIEVHNDPENALSDGAQAVTSAQFKDIVDNVKQLLNAIK